MRENMRKHLLIFWGIIFFTIFLIIPSIVYALNTNDTWYRSTSVAQYIYAHNSCRGVRSTQTDEYFVPTRSSPEWLWFQNAPPSNVELLNCCTSINISGIWQPFRWPWSNPPTPSYLVFNPWHAHFFYPDEATADVLCGDLWYENGWWNTTDYPSSPGWDFSNLAIVWDDWTGSAINYCTSGWNCISQWIPFIRNLHCCNTKPANLPSTPPNQPNTPSPPSCPAWQVYECRLVQEEWQVCQCWTEINDNGSCFVAGTKITLADGTKKDIEDIQIGDKLMWMDKSINKVLHLDQPYLERRRIYSINGSKAFVTEDHPFLTTEWWKSRDPESSFRYYEDIEVSLLKLWDELIREDWSTEVIKSLIFETQNPDTIVYSFDVDGNDTYIANGYIVHNSWAHND